MKDGSRFSRPLDGLWECGGGRQASGWLSHTPGTQEEHGAVGEHSEDHCGGEGVSGSKRSTLVTEKGGRQVGNSERPQGKWGPRFHHFIQEAASQPPKARGDISRTPCSEVR